jgi:hypothetical protein
MNRRQFIQGGIAASSIFLPVPYAWVWAQSGDLREGALKLLKAPKLALVIGNSKYKDAPELKNPANDARGVGEALKAAGFAVTSRLDTGREELIQAIRDYVNAMEKQKAVGLFYFAGHGVQLDWRNYMLPVDAVIDRIEDVAKQSVDIARLMEGLTKASNPMNVIILDACRENPFGTARQPAQKGLSQMDAPTGTFLAYATSPGNVASDGEGANGLYTENLLREMKVPEAKIEDIFKRVRLGVRRASKGAQVPWESTSLEDDFWFRPPAQLKKITEEEKARLFKEEAALWDRAKDVKDPKPLEDYLRRYPSGNFTELAQLRLDQILVRQGEKKVEVATQVGNPYSKGTLAADTKYQVGDTYTYNVLDLYSKAAKRQDVATVAEITENEVRFSNGHVTDLMGNVLRARDGRVFSQSQFLPLEFAVGKRWRTRFTVTIGGGVSDVELEFHIATREKVTVPAGTFDAFRIEARGHSYTPRGIMETAVTGWLAPDVCRRPVARDDRRLGRFGGVAERDELVSFKQG